MTIPEDVEPALVSILRAATAFSGLLGATGGQASIFPQGLPQGAVLPALTYQQIALPPGAQAMGADLGLQWPTYQLTVFVAQSTDAYKTTKIVTKALRTALERVRGSYSVAGKTITIQDILHLGGRDAQWPNLQYVGYSLDVQVIHA